MHTEHTANTVDVAGGQEGVPLLCFITQHEGPRAPDFQYVTSYVMSHDPPIIDGQGCCCDGSSDHSKPCCGQQCPCCCSPLDGSPCYLEDGTPSFMASSGVTEPPYLSECGPSCRCHSSLIQKSCGTQPSQDKLDSATAATGIPCRVTQQGVRHRMTLRHTAKGWSAFAAEGIQRGCFVCTYLGEPVTNKEAAARLHAYDAAGEGHALLVSVSGCTRTIYASSSEVDDQQLVAWQHHGCTLPKHAAHHGLMHSHSTQRLPCCTYCIPCIPSASAWQRSSPAVRQVLRQVLPTGRAAVRLNIDATRYGNAARFFNHRCAPAARSHDSIMLLGTACYSTRCICTGQQHAAELHVSACIPPAASPPPHPTASLWGQQLSAAPGYCAALQQQPC